LQATGSPTVADAEPPDASFVLIDVQGNKVVTYSYLLSAGADEDAVSPQFSPSQVWKVVDAIA
jgi:hypothetical protein